MTTTNPVPSNDPTDLLFNAKKLDQVVNGSAQFYTDRLGVNRRTIEGISAAADVVLGGLGYAPPVAYASGILLTLTTQTVEYSGNVYAPKVASLPFTTSTWATDSAKFRLIQGVASADLASSGGAAMVGYMPAGAGAISKPLDKHLQIEVSVFDFMTDAQVSDSLAGIVSTDLTAAIQAAIDHAETLVSVAVDGVGDKVNGCTIKMRGAFKITEPLRIAKDNICLEGQGGTTIYPYFSSMVGYNGAKPAIIVGTAEAWQTSGSIATTCKYNRITGINIKRVAGQLGFIGVLVSGTRNAIVSDCLFERGFCGIYLENSSEFYSQQVSAIGCTYGVVCDNRGLRPANSSPLNVACNDNDVSSNSFDQLTVYYAQHTGVLLLNTGTTIFNGMTMGSFSDNPSASSPGLQLPTSYAGLHIAGGTVKWTRGMMLNNAVFEAPNDVSRYCVFIESTTASNPVIGVTINNLHVQTFAADHNAGNVTTLLNCVQSGSGDIRHVTLRESGFTYQSGGNYYGNMCNITGVADVRFDGCYPTVAFAASKVPVNAVLSPVEYVERVDVNAFPPTGWTAGGVTTGCSKQGGASGVISSLRFTGDTGDMTVSKRFTLREKINEIKTVFISFLAKGSGQLLCMSRINGDAASFTSVVNATNIGRYSNAIIYPVVDSATVYKRFVFVVKLNDVGYPFDNIDFYIGRKANATASTSIDICDIRVGYFCGAIELINPF